MIPDIKKFREAPCLIKKGLFKVPPSDSIKTAKRNQEWEDFCGMENLLLNRSGTELHPVCDFRIKNIDFLGGQTLHIWPSDLWAHFSEMAYKTIKIVIYVIMKKCNKFLGPRTSYTNGYTQ